MNIEISKNNTQISDILSEFGFPNGIDMVEVQKKGSYLILKPVFKNKKDNQNAVYDNFLKDIKGGVSNDFMSQREQPNIDIREKL